MQPQKDDTPFSGLPHHQIMILVGAWLRRSEESTTKIEQDLEEVCLEDDGIDRMMRVLKNYPRELSSVRWRSNNVRNYIQGSNMTADEKAATIAAAKPIFWRMTRISGTSVGCGTQTRLDDAHNAAQKLASLP